MSDFIEVSGRYSISISSKIHDQVKKQAFVGPTDEVPQNVFDDALEEIKFLLQCDALSRFVANEQFSRISVSAPA